jgi:AcrR family transcriptional regulator
MPASHALLVAKPVIKPSLKRRQDESRIKILDAAVAVISEFGFYRFRLKEIAKRVDLTEAGVLHHFASKEILLHAVLEYREENAKQVIAQLDSLSGLEALRALPELAKNIVAEPQFLQLYLLLEVEGLTPDSSVREFFITRNAANRSALIKHIKKAEELGQIQIEIDPEFLAREAIAFMDGIGLQWLTERQSFDLVAVYRTYFEKFTQQLKPEGLGSARETRVK